MPHIAGGASVRRHEWPCPVFTCARYGTGRGAGDIARTKVLLHFGLEMQSSSLSPAQLAKVAANRARAEALTSERQLRDGVSGAGTAGAGAIVGGQAAAVRHLLHPLVSVPAGGGVWHQYANLVFYLFQKTIQSAMQD